MRVSRRFSNFSVTLAALLIAGAAACDAEAPTAAGIPAFDGGEALRLIETQVAFGPRVPGTEAHGAMAEWLEGELETRGAKVSIRPFGGVSALTGEALSGTNLIASYRTDLDERIFFGAHWDSRALADRDPDPLRRGEPVMGANDGASGVAVLLVLAEMMRRDPPPVGVDLLLFDLEDQGESGSEEGYCLGSRALAAGAAITGFRPEYGVVIDMVGHRDLTIYRERASLQCCARLVEKVHDTGARISPERFPEAGLVELYDDHVPWIEAGIPAIVLAGTGFPEWHTTADRPGICDAASLGAVGELLAHLVWGGHEIP
ncbi:MAG: M28 family peptidase [Candidatus Eisenbacteria bacterium]